MQAEDISSPANKASELLTSLSSSRFIHKLEANPIQDLHDRFSLWAGNIGAFHNGKNKKSLAHRLRGAPKLKDRFVQILHDLIEDLRDLDNALCEREMVYSSPTVDNPPEDVAEVEADIRSLLEAISISISALFRTSSIARRATVRDQYSLALQRVRSFEVEGQGVDLDLVVDTCSRLRNPGLSWLKERLAGAANHRRRYLRFREQHQKDIQSGVAAPRHTRISDDPIPAHQSDTHTEQSSVFNKSTATTVVASKVETAELDLDETESQVSFASHATRYPDSYRFAVMELTKVREAQGASEDQPEMICRYCKNEVACETQKAWEKHVMADLKAYLCTSKNCKLQLFSSKRAWMQHELDEHLTRWTCHYCAGEPLFTPLSQYQDHMRTHHGPQFHESQLEQLAAVSSHVIANLPASSCPFCDWTERRRVGGKHASESVTPKQYRDHVAAHMEQLALAILPESELRIESHDQDDIGSDTELQKTPGTRIDVEDSEPDHGDQEPQASQQDFQSTESFEGSSQPDAAEESGLGGSEWDFVNQATDVDEGHAATNVALDTEELVEPGGVPGQPLTKDATPLNDETSGHATAAAGDYAQNAATHWAQEVFDGAHPTTQYRDDFQSKQPSSCYGRVDLDALQHLVRDGFQRVAELSFDDERLWVRFYWRNHDSRSRLLIMTTDPSGSQLHYCLPLTALKVMRKASTLQLCQASKDSGRYALWSLLKFTLHEKMVLFYSTFVAMKNQDTRGIQDASLVDGYELELDEGESMLFAGQIQHNNMLHALRIFRDRGSGVVRLQANALRGPRKAVPIWTAFVTRYAHDPDWCAWEGNGIVSLAAIRPAPPYVFVTGYQPPKNHMRNWVLPFTTDEDARMFVECWAGICRRFGNRIDHPESRKEASRGESAVPAGSHSRIEGIYSSLKEPHTRSDFSPPPTPPPPDSNQPQPNSHYNRERSLLLFANDCEDAAAGLHRFRDTLPRYATRITAIVGELFAISSALRQIHTGAGTRSYGPSFYRIDNDLQLVFRSLQATTEDVFEMFARSQERTEQVVWEDMLHTHERVEGYGLLERLEWYRDMLDCQFDLLEGRETSNPSVLRDNITDLLASQQRRRRRTSHMGATVGSIDSDRKRAGSTERGVDEQKSTTSLPVQSKDVLEENKADQSVTGRPSITAVESTASVTELVPQPPLVASEVPESDPSLSSFPDPVLPSGELLTPVVTQMPATNTEALAPLVQDAEMIKQSNSDESSELVNSLKSLNMRSPLERELDKGERVGWTSSSGRNLYGKVHDYRLRNNAWEYQLREEDSGALYEKGKWVGEGVLELA